MGKPLHHPVLMLIGSRRWLAGLRDRNQVRIAPKIEKRCNGMDAFPNFTANQKLGGMVDGSCCQESWFPEIRGGCQPLKPITDGNSSAAAVMGVKLMILEKFMLQINFPAIV